MFKKILISYMLISTNFEVAMSCPVDQWTRSSAVFLVSQLENPHYLPRAKHTLEKQGMILHALNRLDEKVRIVSFNILFNCTEERFPEHYQWPARLPRIIKLFEYMRPDVIAVQELYPEQLKDLEACIGSEFEFYVGSLQKGELNGIFYRKERFEIDREYDVTQQIDILKNGDKRLPFDQKEHEDAKKYPAKDMMAPELEPGQMFTVLHLCDKKTQRKFAIVNAHFTFRKIHSRACQANYVAQKILKPLGETKPVIFTGDLNTFPNRGDLPMLPFNDGDDILKVISQKSKLDNAMDNALLGHLGMSSSTNNAFAPVVRPFDGLGNPGVFADHIYVSDRVQTIVHAVESALVDGFFVSDHFPIFIDCLIEETPLKAAEKEEAYFFPA
jgi:endonuclease/exonuclease/phosphatase family metal-dependent hydrolase